MKTILCLISFVFASSFIMAQQRRQVRYSNAPQNTTVRVNAAPQYNPYTSQAAYYQAFIQQMTPVYNVVNQVQRVSNAVVNYGSYFAGENGAVVRSVYNNTQQYVIPQQINLPQGYAPAPVQIQMQPQQNRNALPPNVW